MNYPLLAQKMPQRIKKVWQKSIFLTSAIFVLLGIIMFGILRYLHQLSALWGSILIGYFLIVLIVTILKFRLGLSKRVYFSLNDLCPNQSNPTCRNGARTFPTPTKPDSNCNPHGCHHPPISWFRYGGSTSFASADHRISEGGEGRCLKRFIITR